MNKTLNKLKILMMSGLYYGELTGPIEYFQENNFDVHIFEAPALFSKWALITRIKNRFGLDVSKYKSHRSDKITKAFIKEFYDVKPDIVYVVGGKQLSSSGVREIQKKCLIVAEMRDRIDFFPEVYPALPYYDAVYTFSPEDAKKITEIGGNGIYFNTHVSREKFAKKLDMKKDIDVAFVGNMYPQKDYGERYQMLKKLIKELPEYVFYIGGKCAPLKRPELFIKWLFDSRVRSCFINKSISRKECNEIYNRAKICLTINRTDTGNTWTDRLINIMATGSFQLVTYTDNVVKEFEGQLDTFKDYDELKAKVIFYLKNEKNREKIAQRGYIEYIHNYEKKEAEGVITDIQSRYKMRNFEEKQNEHKRKS